MNKDNKIFNSDDAEEIEADRLLDDLANTVGKDLELLDQSDLIVVPEKVEKLLCVYKSLNHLIGGQDGVDVSYKLFAPFKFTGSVTVSGKHSIKIENPQWIIDAASLASNLDIYPQTNGLVKLVFTFNGLTKLIK